MDNVYNDKDNESFLDEINPIHNNKQAADNYSNINNRFTNKYNNNNNNNNKDTFRLRNIFKWLIDTQDNTNNINNNHIKKEIILMDIIDHNENDNTIESWIEFQKQLLTINNFISLALQVCLYTYKTYILHICIRYMHICINVCKYIYNTKYSSI